MLVKCETIGVTVVGLTPGRHGFRHRRADPGCPDSSLVESQPGVSVIRFLFQLRLRIPAITTAANSARLESSGTGQQNGRSRIVINFKVTLGRVRPRVGCTFACGRETASCLAEHPLRALLQRRLSVHATKNPVGTIWVIFTPLHQDRFSADVPGIVFTGWNVSWVVGRL